MGWWLGDTVSSLGSAMSGVAYPLLMLYATGSAAQAGTVAAGNNLGLLATLLLGGALADRYPRRRLLILGPLAQAASVTIVVWAVLNQHVHVVLISAVAVTQGLAAGVTSGADRPGPAPSRTGRAATGRLRPEPGPRNDGATHRPPGRWVAVRCGAMVAVRCRRRVLRRRRARRVRHRQGPWPGRRGTVRTHHNPRRHHRGLRLHPRQPLPALPDRVGRRGQRHRGRLDAHARRPGATSPRQLDDGGRGLRDRRGRGADRSVPGPAGGPSSSWAHGVPGRGLAHRHRLRGHGRGAGGLADRGRPGFVLLVPGPGQRRVRDLRTAPDPGPPARPGVDRDQLRRAVTALDRAAPRPACWPTASASSWPCSSSPASSWPWP